MNGNGGNSRGAWFVVRDAKRQRLLHPPNPLSLTPANTRGRREEGVNDNDENGRGAWFVARGGERPTVYGGDGVAAPPQAGLDTEDEE